MKCQNCESTNIKSRVIDHIGWEPCEIEYTCKDCKSHVAYWAYGNFETDTPEESAE